MENHDNHDKTITIGICLSCWVGRLSGTETGEMLRVDCGTVGIERKQLREILNDDKHFLQIIKRGEADL